jgi:hypothetical protein
MSRPFRLVPQAARAIEFSCPLCGSEHAAYIFSADGFRIFRCAGCSLTFSKTLRSAEPPTAESRDRRNINNEEHHATLLRHLEAADISSEILIVADAGDGLLPLLKGRGIPFRLVGSEEDFERADWDGKYRAAIVTGALMRVADPSGALRKIHQHLAEGAPTLLTLPLLDSQQARLMGRNWHEWQAVNLWYYTRETLHLLLLSANFKDVWFEPEHRRYSLDDLSDRMQGHTEATLWLRGLKMLQRLLPRRLQRSRFRLPSGTTVVSATTTQARSESAVSIVVPAFNEKATFQTMMDALLAKSIVGLRKEIIIVESNSTDGTRELAQSYAGHPDVRVVLQSRPRGKGNAVREGLALATGDIVMIQDADLEYDLDDYDGLLAPLIARQSMFILGSRHQDAWKMRKFTDAPLTAAVFNFGHWFFKTAINSVLRTKMADPFTMYKVFRRDALYGIDFVCNRFDFDIELVIKLVRKGYVPVELPVNYTSRSFAEGKKVSFTRDGMTWLWTIVKLRFSPIGRGPAR